MDHVFKGGTKRATVTKQHKPLIWECMLATVYARGLDGTVVYFDYDWAAARQHAAVDQYHDLRISRTKVSNQGWPRRGKVALWGVKNG